jgi:glycosyltransferase involved in cell wall biosynthesis
MERITAVVIVRDEEEQLGACLETVIWVDEIVVVDTGSRDGTVEVARRYTTKIAEIQFEGYGHAKNYGVDMATSEWVLSLDADERISEDLRDEIRDLLEGSPAGDGYLIPRLPFFLGKPIRHGGWYPAYVLRLFRRDSGSFTHRKVHEEAVVRGTVLRLAHPILHYTDPDLSHYLKKVNHYTSLSAEEMSESRKPFRLWWLLLRPPYTFLKMYLLKRGFRDGLHGFVLAVLSSVHVFLKYAKYWEVSSVERDADSPDM